MSAPAKAKPKSKAKAKSPPPRLKWLFLGGLVLIVAVAVTAYFVGRSYRSYTIKGQEFADAPQAYDFTMISSKTGEEIRLSDFYGKKYVLLYFGYTTCPDVCPATLNDVAAALNMLGDQAKNVQFLWITVDPERDSPEKMEDYVKHFHPDFLGLTPRSEEETFAVATQYGIFYEKHYYGSEAGYLMDHTATITLVDQNGSVRVIYPFGTLPEDLAADLEYQLHRPF
jgi:protein SCO1/2